MNVYDRLKRYKSQKARCEYLKLQLEGLQDNIRNGYGISETKDETIEGLALRTNTEGMPSGGFEDSKTERIALNLDKETSRLNVDSYRLFEEKRNLEQRIAPLDKEVKETEAMLSVLGKEERLVIEKWYFDLLRISNIQDTFYERFKNYPSYATVKNIKQRAIGKMERVISS